MNSINTKDGVAGGEWLYRQGELILGPLPVEALLEKLYLGQVDGSTEIQRLGGQGFRRLAEVDVFKVHWARAQAKMRVDAAALAQAQLERRQRLIKALLVIIIGAIGAGLAAYGAVYLAIHKPWKTVDDNALLDITDVAEPPVISRANSAEESEEWIALPGVRRPNPPPAPESKSSAEAPANRNGNKGDLDSVGFQTVQFDQQAINAVVAKNQKLLHVCFAQEAKNQPGLAAKIPVEFSIGNNGRVSRVSVNHPSFKTGSLPDCLLRELQKWKFPPYEGQLANVGIAFRIGKPEL